ncbi:type I-F CRISPR-associated protein Csy1 [Psychromonas antarctica]|uniref:type I-F CRISPR-associated protein Csy1 n=1 Tax=Psychromonas antarctica TaxID=67573 RepID=UPI001EE812FD|nr:type I-F CRISPR-associated protein Csy1 [Psychromonas antarctica]MCG6202246.1 type I-F CRISPR-associated protein Csy1 [Psychromonas antarctica]
MMIEEIQNNNWRDVIILFFQTSINTSALAKANKYIEEKSAVLKAESNAQKQERLSASIEKKKLDLDILKSNPNEIVEWLDANAIKKISVGSRIIKSTHPLKFSHSSAPNDGVLVDCEDELPLLNTASISNDSKTFDMAHNNGALISISRFLALSYGGFSIYDLILENDFCFLDGFYKNKAQLKIWKSGFSELVEKRNIKSASFTKQIYFPVDSESYHLLAPLASSTLAESIFTKITNAKYKKRTDYFHEDGSLSPRLIMPQNKNAVIRVGGNNPQNVSMLNRGRNWKLYKDSKSSYGVFYVVSSEPPVWHSQLKAPIYKTNFFYDLSANYEVKENIQYLSDFLTRFENLQLSIKDPKRMRWVEEWVENLTDEVLVYVKNIQTLPAGWSAIEEIKLKPEHQVLLDCYRQDEDFSAMKNSSNWQTVIIQDFAVWLNNRLAEANGKFTPQDAHTKLWMKIFKANFREGFITKELTQQEETV